MTVKNTYIRDVLVALIDKHNKKIISGSGESNRRVQADVSKLFKGYGTTAFGSERKRAVETAINILEQCNYITAKRKDKFSDTVEKVYLNTEKVQDIEQYLSANFGITLRRDAENSLNQLIARYRGLGELTEYYCDSAANGTEMLTKDAIASELEKKENIFNALAFIQKNRENLYLREASMLIYGDSKRLEQDYYTTVCSIVKGCRGEEIGDEPLAPYHIINVDQDICLKGDVTIALKEYTLEVRHFSGGISLLYKDIPQIQKITVNTPVFMTIENKTSYQRYADESVSTMYLGGFSNHQQEWFIQRLYDENNSIEYRHWGDIDIGGFLIHQALCNQTGVPFSTYMMGIEQLKDKRYEKCLQPLFEKGKDRSRTEGLRNNPEYGEVIRYMLERDVKLEQEIISYWIMQDKL